MSGPEGTKGAGRSEGRTPDNLVAEKKARIHAELVRAWKSAVSAGELPQLEPLPDFSVEVPRERAHGDFAANIALLLARPLRRPPRAVAETLLRHLDEAAAGLARAEVAGPGFINCFLRPHWAREVIPTVLERGAAYGRSSASRGERVLLEFVSANPTGPLNVVNGRAAAFGDALARLLEATGSRVTREYYVNDAGTQFERLGLSMAIRCRQALGDPVELPEEAYPGAYLKKLARAFLGENGLDDLKALARREEAVGAEAHQEQLARFAVERIVADQRRVLEAYGVHFDRWQRKSELRASGGPEAVLARLRERGLTFERDGALWFRASQYGDDQDRVLVRSSGAATYFLPDIAYHAEKLERGYHRLINIWGQDHHGYVRRLSAALAALGADPARLEVLLTQMVRVVRGGEVLRMSKRAGEFIALEDFLAEAGRDAARFLFLTRSVDSTMDFDLDLAKRQSQENPVYYVQYAHTRIAGLLRQAREAGLAPPSPPLPEKLLDCLVDPREDALMRWLAFYPEEIAQAAAQREPHRLTVYLRELAAAFHLFYTHCRVLGEEATLSRARLALALAAGQVLRNGLGLLGVSAPEQM